MKISQDMDLQKRYAGIVDSEIFINIIRDLIEENKQLKKQVEVMDTILHSYLPLIGDEQRNNKTNK